MPGPRTATYRSNPGPDRTCGTGEVLPTAAKYDDTMTHTSDGKLRSKVTTTIVIATVIVALVLTTIILFSHGATGLAGYSLGIGMILVVFLYFAS